MFRKVNKKHFMMISKSTVPVKGILADFNKIKTRTVDEVDGDLIRDIYFYFC